MKFREFYLQEKFGMEGYYSVPKDKEHQLFDFYALTMFNPDALMDEEAVTYFKQAKETIVDALKKDFTNALYTSLAAELFHIPYKTDYRSFTNKELESTTFTKKELDLISDMYDLIKETGMPNYEERTKFFKELNNMSPFTLASFAKKAFNEDILEWRSQYGGKNWEKIANGLERLLNAEKIGDKIVAIDHVYDLQHNTGTVFTKVKDFAKHNDDFTWLQSALNYKRDATEPHVYLDNISYQLYRPMAYALKKLYNKTLEDYIKIEKERQQEEVNKIKKRYEWIIKNKKNTIKNDEYLIRYGTPIAIVWIKSDDYVAIRPINISIKEFENNMKKRGNIIIEIIPITDKEKKQREQMIKNEIEKDGKKYTQWAAERANDYNRPFIIWASPYGLMYDSGDYDKLSDSKKLRMKIDGWEYWKTIYPEVKYDDPYYFPPDALKKFDPIKKIDFAWKNKNGNKSILDLLNYYRNNPESFKNPVLKIISNILITNLPSYISTTMPAFKIRELAEWLMNSDEVISYAKFKDRTSKISVKKKYKSDDRDEVEKVVKDFDLPF